MLFEDERWLAMALLFPTMALLGLFIAYPFVTGVLLSLSSARVGVPGEFVGLANFAKLWNDPIFARVVWNTCVYTAVTTVFKLALGLWLAVLLNRHFRGKALVRAFILLPFIIPTVLSTFAWKWMFDPTFSVLNWVFYKLGLISGRINWLGDPDLRCFPSWSSTSGAACPSTPSACSPGCRRSARTCTRPRRSTARGPGTASGT
jgi:multiple sugar transport system permease protein